MPVSLPSAKDAPAVRAWRIYCFRQSQARQGYVKTMTPIESPDAAYDRIIQPHRGWFDWRLRQCGVTATWYALFVWRDFVSVYKQTILGPAWHILQPLFTTLTFTLVFGRVAGCHGRRSAVPLLYGGHGCVGLFRHLSRQYREDFRGQRAVAWQGVFPSAGDPNLARRFKSDHVRDPARHFPGFLALYVFSGAAVHITGWVLLTPVLLLMLAGYGLGGGILVAP